jgi:hypothetical protein
MALGRIYTAESGTCALATTTPSALLWAWPNSAAVTMDILAVRVGVTSSGGAPSYPSNGIVQVQLVRATGTITGGATPTPAPHNSSDIAANSVWKSASTAITVQPTVGAVLWSQQLPFTAGANWAEWVSPGAEWRVPASGTAGTGIALMTTQSSAGTNTAFTAEIVFAE